MPNNQNEILARCVQQHFNLGHDNLPDEDCEQPTTPSDHEEIDSVDHQNNVFNELENMRWTSKQTFLLLTLYEKHMAEFENGKKSHRSVWNTISTEIENHNYHITWVQCENKLKNFKKTYKKILDNHRNTGRSKVTWEFFDRMDELFSKKPEITPVQICSSGDLVDKMQKSPAFPEITDSGTSTPVSIPADNIIRRRKRNRSEDEPVWFKHFREDCEKRHKERMDIQNKFLTIFEKLVNKK